MRAATTGGLRRDSGWGWRMGATRWAGTFRLFGNYPETILKPRLAGLGWQGSGLVWSGWAGLGLAGLDSQGKKGGPTKEP